VSPPVGSPYRWIFGEGEKYQYKIEGHSTHSARTFWAGRGAEQRLKELPIKLPVPPRPFGTYVEGVQTGKLVFLTGVLPTEGRGAKFIGRVGAEIDAEAGRKAAHLAALNVLAVARQHLGSLDQSDAGRPVGSPLLGANP